MPRLTGKQLRFVEEYMIDMNAAAAARRAGYAPKRADAVGFNLLRKTEIQETIQAKRQERSASTGITAERVIQEIARIAFADPRVVMEWGANGITLRNSSSLTDDQAAAVMEVSETRSESGGSIKVKLHNKVEALEKLAKHVGLYNPRSGDDDSQAKAVADAVRRKLGL